MSNAIPNWLVIVLGLAIVFIGLISIIILCTIMSKVVRSFGKKTAGETASTVSTPVSSEPIANKQEILAAVCAVVADNLDTEVSGIKVLSFKRI